MCVTSGGWITNSFQVEPVRQEALRLAAAWGKDRHHRDIVAAAVAFEKYLRDVATTA